MSDFAIVNVIAATVDTTLNDVLVWLVKNQYHDAAAKLATHRERFGNDLGVSNE